jgi:two-component system sensor histidine kinase KdpD
LKPVLFRYLLAAALCALTALLALPLRGWLDLANIVMLFLLAVFVIAVRLGRGPAVLAAFLSVALFDVFFVHPYLSLGVEDAQYLVTFAVMLAVGLIASHQAVQLVARTEEGKAREHAIQTEKLRASILSSISHDLRTPLTSLVGMADALAEQRAGLPAEVGEKAEIIRDQAHAMHRMVSNLLDMARLQSGRVALNLQWQPLEEIVGASVRLLDDVLSIHPLTIDLPVDLPLIRFDAVLMERVLCNLLENAAKYSPPESTITLSARTQGGRMEVSICNAGSAFPTEHPEQVFDLFARGLQEPAIAGAGLGLAICRAIITAHEGTIIVGNRAGQACVTFTLPLGTPPQVERE